MFDDEKREVLSLPPRTPVVISGVQERFLGFAQASFIGLQERFLASLEMTIREKRYPPTPKFESRD